MSGVGAKLAGVLAQQRQVFNMRFRRGGRGLEPEAFFRYLEHTVAPLVEQVEGDGVQLTEALFDLGLMGMRRGLIGRAEPSSFEGALLAHLPRLNLRAPRRLLTSLGNAYDRLSRHLDVETADDWMAALAAHAEDESDALGVGLVLAWKLGLSEARNGALARLGAMSAQQRERLVGVREIDLDPTRRFTALGEKGPVGAPQVMARLGGFLGFGGPFVLPPEVRRLHGRLYVTDGDVVREVFADVFGARLCRAPSATVMELLDDGVIGENVSVTRYGTVRWGRGKAKLAALAGANTCATADGVAVVTLKRSHYVFVVGRVAA
jgi:hypothetical protein